MVTTSPASHDALVRRLPGRAHGWTTVFELHCPNGHHIKQDSLVLEHGAIRCKHKTQSINRPGEKGYECGAWLYVLGSVGWNIRTDANGREHVTLGDDVYTVQVTWEELQHIRGKRLNAAQTLRYLGIPVASSADVPRRGK